MTRTAVTSLSLALALSAGCSGAIAHTVTSDQDAAADAAIDLGTQDTTVDAPEGAPEDAALDPPTPPGRAVALALGRQHACALDDAGHVYCWGASDVGQTGTGQHAALTVPQQVPLPPIAEIAAGEAHTCAREPSGRVWCWGFGADGQLGVRGTGLPACAASQCAPEPMRVPAFEPAARIFAGGEETCVWLGDESLRCFGDAVPRAGVAASVHGLLDLATGRHVTCWLTADELRCSGDDSGGARGDGDLDDGLVRLADVRAIDVGQGHACAVTSDGGVHCWGEGFGGTLGLIDAALPMRCDVQGCATSPIAIDGAAPASAISTALERTCVIGTDAHVRCWGEWDRTSTNICDEASTLFCDLHPVEVAELLDPAQVSVGGEAMCAITRGGGVRCVGMSDDGVLGDGSRASGIVTTPSWVEGFPHL